MLLLINKRIISLFCVIACLAGCGQQGPLYLPPKAKAPTTTIHQGQR